MLGESHRGGKRVRKKPKLETDDDPKTSASPATSHMPHQSYQPSVSVSASSSTYSPASHHVLQPSEFHNHYDTRQEQGFTWQQQRSTPTTAGSDSGFSRHTEQTNVSLRPLPWQDLLTIADHEPIK